MVSNMAQPVSVQVLGWHVTLDTGNKTLVLRCMQPNAMHHDVCTVPYTTSCYDREVVRTVRDVMFPPTDDAFNKAGHAVCALHVVDTARAALVTTGLVSDDFPDVAPARGFVLVLDEEEEEEGQGDDDDV